MLKINQIFTPKTKPQTKTIQALLTVSPEDDVAFPQTYTPLGAMLDTA